MSLKPFKIAVFISLFLVVSCGGRVPSAKTAQSVSRSYFKNYGKKYQSSDFGYGNVQNVTINGVEEISHKFALVDTSIDFLDGKRGRALLRLERKFPQGWKVVSWERVR